MRKVYPLIRKTNSLRGPLAGLILLPLFLAAAAFFPHDRATVGEGHCTPVERFYGYTFLYPELLNKDAAYAPFFLRWEDYYQTYYFNRNIQKEENIAEWIGRFCDQPLAEDVEEVVYQSDLSALGGLYKAAADEERRVPLPYSLDDNTFAEMLAYNHCTETVVYLIYARQVEPFVVEDNYKWSVSEQDTARMYQLIREGVARLSDTDSHFLRLRYAYQVVRLAHYMRDYAYTIDLYHYLMPKIDLKKPSIIYFWTLGHLAGALQKTGKLAEANYRYSQIFRYCASKRLQAYRSIYFRNDKDWQETLDLCKNDGEKSTLHIIRASGSPAYSIVDINAVYELEPRNPQLNLLLVSNIQQLEKVFLGTWVTDRKHGKPSGAMKRQIAAQHLIELRKFVQLVIREKKVESTKVWRAMEGYLALIAGDRYTAENTWKRLDNDLGRSDEDKKIYRQLQIWRLLTEILNLDKAIVDAKAQLPKDSLKNFNPDALAYRIRGYDAFKYNPYFEPFLQDWLSSVYAAKNRPGRAILAAYAPEAVTLNPNREALDDLIKLAAENDPILLEKTMQMDTNPDRVKTWLLEIKGAMLLSKGQPEAALSVMRGIIPTEDAAMRKFTPFKEHFSEQIHLSVFDTLNLNRREIAQKILNYEFRAKAAEGNGDTIAARYYYLIGLAYYNMSYFGYEWEATDFYRSGYNWNRLATGPVFPLPNSPDGNRENTDMDLPLSYFEKAMQVGKGSSIVPRALFMAARCRQKQYFLSPDCPYRYKPESNLIPVLPEEYFRYYDLLIRKFGRTDFFEERIKECKWLAAYAR